MADLFKILLAEKLGHCDSLYESVIGKKLGGYSWISTDYEQTPYIYRAMPNMSHYYNREIMDAVVGGSVGWNQLCNGSSATVQSGRKYFLKKGSAESVGASTDSAITGLTSGSDMVVDLTLALGSTIADYVYSLEQSTAGSGVAWLKQTFPKMFGQYNPYDSGSIQSVRGLVSHDMVGFNQWDEEWEVGEIYSNSGQNSPSGMGTQYWRSKNYVRVMPNTTYYVCSPTATNKAIRARYYDADKNYIGYVDGDNIQTYTDHTFLTPSNCHYIRFAPEIANIPNHDICINISDTSRNGQYEPYHRNSYPLDSTVTLRGRFYLDANNKLCADGDTYGADGTVTRKWKHLDLGSIVWNMTTEGFFYSNEVADIKAGSSSGGYNHIVTAKYVAENTASLNALADKGISIDTGRHIQLRDSTYSDANTLRTALNGVYADIELATPTTETAQPFTKTQNCDSGGTEEFVTSGIVSVGHKSKYAEK